MAQRSRELENAPMERNRSSSIVASGLGPQNPVVS
jgi:hypothetical protein